MPFSFFATFFKLAVFGVVRAQEETCGIPGSTECEAVKVPSLLQVTSAKQKVEVSDYACIDVGDYCLYESRYVNGVDAIEYAAVKDMEACNVICEKHDGSDVQINMTLKTKCIGFLVEKQTDANGYHRCQLVGDWGTQGGMMGHPHWNAGVPVSRTTTTTTIPLAAGVFQLKKRGSDPATCVTEVEGAGDGAPDVLYQMLPCADDHGVRASWDRSAQGIFTNKFSGKCIGFAKGWENGNAFMNNLLVPLDQSRPESECAREDTVGSRGPHLRIPDCVAMSRSLEDADEYVSKNAVAKAFMQCQAALESVWNETEKKFGNTYLVSYGPSYKTFRVDVVEVPPTVLLSSSASASSKPKSCPTLQEVQETSEESRFACWNRPGNDWWNRCVFNHNNGECGASTKVGGGPGIPCWVYSLQDVETKCLVPHDVVTFESPETYTTQ